jgi:hypothetical protein|tara:strand:+ start:1498 stop:2085 length:588 start_codon:yes stop_codon:yes gene_type:complete
MSANGAFSTTLDFEFFGGGYLQLSGEVSGTIGTSFVSYAQVPITGHISPVTLDFEFTAGIETPTIYGRATDLSFGFTSSSFIEFGVQRYISVANNVLFDYTSESSGLVLTHANFNPTLEFTLDTNIYVFSEGDSIGSYSFSVESVGLNISTRTYSKDGANYTVFNSTDFNDLLINDESNSIKLTNTGMTQVEILQ